MPTQRKLQVFLYWYHDGRKRGMVPLVADFNANTMTLAVNEFDSEKRAKI